MVIKALDDNVIAQIRSSSSIDSVTQCVTELVLNSLDAKATAIAIRVNLSTFRIQVVDNGRGISRSNLESVGVRYMTNKCHTLEDLKKHLKYYGFKGEALANISKISQRLIIATREQNCEDTFVKTFEKNEDRIDAAKSRASFGTTVTVEGFLHNLPVRQQCVKNNELENVKRSLESLIIIHPRVSFTLRNDFGAKLLLSSEKCADIASSFRTIHPEIDENEFALLKVSKGRISVEGLIHRDFHENKRLQYVYVNKRSINCPKVQALIGTLFKKALKPDPKKKNPIFVIHIKCPYSDVDINLEPTKTVVFFKKFDILKRCIEKMIKTFLGGEDAHCVAEKVAKHVASEFGVSQLNGAVKGFGNKRKTEEFEEVSNKSAKIVEDTPFFEEPKVPTKLAKMALPIEIKKSDKKDFAADSSLFTNFPENEQTGKNVIMDMFIKSLTVFPSENAENQNLARSASTEELSQNKVTLGVQTTPHKAPTKDMVSVGVQAGSSVPDLIVDSDITFFPRKSLKKYVSDYDFDFSTISFPFNFNPNRHTLPFDNFNQTKKLFDFRNHRSAIYQPSEISFDRIEKPRKIFSQRLKPVQQSPYFLKKAAPKLFALKPPENREESYNWGKPAHCENFNQVEITFLQKDSTKRHLNESTVSKYFTPKKINTIETCNESEDLFRFAKSQDFDKSQSDFVMVDENDAQKSDKDVTYENKTGDMIAPTLTLNQRVTGTPYPNKTDFSKKDIAFEITGRFDFVPKGLSPILKDYGKVDDMSPESKEQLQNALIQSYEDELLLIKWQNYIHNKDPKSFFEEMYLEKSKLFESSIPNITKSGHAKHAMRGFENMSFTKALFKNLEIIGQVDCKFIAVLESTRKLVLLFDQHAVHERVRLEELSESYKSASTKLDQNITIFMPHNDLSLLKRQKINLNSLGLVLDFFTNGITVHQVPLCVYNKSKKGVDIVSLTEALIKEIIETLKTNNGIIVNTPKIIQNIVNSEACRGAIKFGDLLTRNECIAHLKKLSECNLPFQCAHGRPTLTPLIFLNRFLDTPTLKPQLSNLK